MQLDLALRCGALIALALSSSCGQAPSTPAQSTWYVDVHGTAPGSGTQSDPFTSVQYAISRPTTLNGHTLLVAPGTYHEQVDFLGKSIHVIGTSGAANTVIVGEFQASPGLGGNFNASVVTLNHGEGAETLLAGFTITGGFGSGNKYGTVGGGILSVSTSATFVDLVLEGNHASYGSGMCIAPATFGFSHARVVGCTIQNNSGSGVVGSIGDSFEACTIRGNSGGGFAGNSTLRNCLIAENHGNSGAGVDGTYFPYYGPTLIGCVVRDNNSTDYYGGGVLGPAVLEDCTITGNTGHGKGGGVYGATANGCEIAHNTLFDWHGAVPISQGGGAADCVLVDCNVHDNAAVFEAQDQPSIGGGFSGGTAMGCRIWNNTADKGAGFASATLENCTVFGNTASIDGGAFGKIPGMPTHIHNSILWGDAPNEIQTGTSPPTTYCDVQNGATGTGNIAIDPLFWAPLAADFHLKTGSPCIDAGDPADMDPDGSRIDIGAYPFDPDYHGPLGKYCSAKMNSQGCTPEIGWSGNPSLSGPDDFLVTASQELNHRSGFLLWSTTRASNFVLGGILCVAAFKRTPSQDSDGSALPIIDCSGRYRYHFSHAYMDDHGLTVGTTVYAQYYARDPFHVDGMGTSLSNALQFTICP